MLIHTIGTAVAEVKVDHQNTFAAVASKAMTEASTPRAYRSQSPTRRPATVDELRENRLVDSDWVAHRTEAARVQAERLAERQGAVHAKAEALIAQFMTAVRAHGPAPVPLVVRGYGGRGQARTNLTGWYLRNDRTAAVGSDGKFYVLIAPLSTMDRIKGVQPQPSRPPLILGEGGKDGDTIELSEALDRVLPNWQSMS